ncbi:MAG: sporulation protein YabP [Clostridia bacterium]|nr:sporulation protein YabP [Clostridia bacterium]MEE1116105.1 sporulation protein YabP [Clostridia bacterium]
MNDYKSEALPHNITVNDRKRLNVNGITEVISFDEASVCLCSVCGDLFIDGEGLHVTTLDIDRGVVSIDGQIDAISYAYESSKDKNKKKEKNAGGLFGKRQK